MSESGSNKPIKDRQWLVEIEPWHRTFWPNLREFFSRQPAPAPAPRVPGVVVAPAPRLNVELHDWHWHEALLAAFKELLRLEKEPPLRTSVKPVPVVDIWDWRTYRQQFERTTLLSTLIHATVVLIVVLPFVRQAAQAETQPQPSIQLVSEDIAPYKVTLPQSKKKAGGGGGGGERNPLPASKGRLPRFSLQAQLAPPAAVIRNPNPRLAVEPTVVVPPDIQIQSPNIAAYGDPTSASQIPSSGPGYGGGIGTGYGGGVGPGSGGGVGPGHGGGFGGGAFRVGGSVSAPICIYCPEPEYPEEARKARWMGTVIVWAEVDEHGNVRDARVQKSMGMGLDEEAYRAVMNYKFRPAERGGRPVPVVFAIEVNFRLY